MNTNEAGISLSPGMISPLRYNSRNLNPHESTGIIISLIRKNTRVLDVGCGTGSISSLIIEKNNVHLVGIEPNQERARKASECGFKVINSFFSRDVVKEYGNFDYVLFADVLEHIVDPVDILVQARSILSEDGRIVASIPNVAHWTVRLKLLAGIFDYSPAGIMDATHLRWFTRKSVERLFSEAGFEIETLRGSAGGWMGVYRYTPLRFVSEDTRSSVLSWFCRWFPALFSAQHVVVARPR